MRSFLPLILSLLISTFLAYASIGLLNTLIPLRAAQHGFPGMLIGSLTSAYYLGFLVGTFTLPPLVRRIGHIRAFAFGTAVAAMIALSHTMSHSAWLWLALRFGDGLIMVGIYTIIESWINAQVPSHQRGGAFATYMMVNLGAQAVAQQFLLVHGEPYLLFNIVAWFACAAAIPIVLTHQNQPVQQTTPRLHLKELFSAAPTAGAGAFLTGLGMGAFYGMAPIYALRIGFSTAGISTFMMLGILGGAALQWPLGRWSDTVDRRLAIMEVSLLAAVASLFFWLLGQHLLAVEIFFFIYSGLAFAIYPMAVAHLIDYLKPEQLLGASSTVYLIYGTGSALGPFVAGALMGRFGARALPIWFAIIHLTLAIYALMRYFTRQREQVTANNFMPLARTAPIALRRVVVKNRFLNWRKRRKRRSRNLPG